jgi:hypothetical protein
MQWWTGKDHDRVRLVLWWEHRLSKLLLSDITLELIRDTLKPKKSQAPPRRIINTLLFYPPFWTMPLCNKKMTAFWSNILMIIPVNVSVL